VTPRSALGVVFARVAAFEDATSIRAAPMGERHTVYAPSCRRCGHGKRVRVTARKGGDMHCAACRARWPRRYVYDSAGGGTRRLHSAQQDRLERYADLGLRLRGLTLWEERVLMASAATIHESGRRIESVLRYCRAMWPRRRAGWSRENVRALLEDARRKVERGLARRGMFDEGGEHGAG